MMPACPPDPTREPPPSPALYLLKPGATVQVDQAHKERRQGWLHLGAWSSPDSQHSAWEPQTGHAVSLGLFLQSVIWKLPGDSPRSYSAGLTCPPGPGWMTGFEPQLLSLTRQRPWAGCFTSLSLSILTCDTGTTAESMLLRHWLQGRPPRCKSCRSLNWLMSPKSLTFSGPLSLPSKIMVLIVGSLQGLRESKHRKH